METLAVVPTSAVETSALETSAVDSSPAVETACASSSAAETLDASVRAGARLLDRIRSIEDRIQYAVSFPDISGGPLLRRQLQQLQSAAASLAKGTVNAAVAHHRCE